MKMSLGRFGFFSFTKTISNLLLKKVFPVGRMVKNISILRIHKVMPKVVLVLCFISVSTLVQAKPPYKVIAYLATTYNGDGSLGGRPQLTVSNIPWSTLSSIYAFVATVNNNSTISYSQLTTYNNLISTAHSNNTRVYLTIGGQNSDSNFSPATSSAANTTTLVNNIMTAVNNGGFDGVDIDWEFPTGTDESQFMSFMQQLSTALRAQNAFDGSPMGIDFFVSPLYQICGVNWGTIGQYVDYGIIGGYGYAANIGGASYNGPVSDPGNIQLICGTYDEQYSISGDSTELTTLGFPVSKLIVGVAFTNSDSSGDIYQILQNGTFVSSANGTPEMESVYTYNSSKYGVDDGAAFCNKISWALGQGMPGIALFELSQGCPYTDAPVVPLWNAISDSSSCVTLPTPTFTATTTSTATATPTNTPCFVGGVPCTSTATPTATNTQTVTPTVVGVTVPIVYPNPTSGQPVNLRLPLKQVSDVTVQIFTLAFRKVWQQNFPQVAPSTALSVPLSDASGTQLANGLYYIVALTSEGTYKTKLLILR